MKRRLFWKILLGFWITFVTITLAVWGGLTLYSNRSSPQTARVMVTKVIQNPSRIFQNSRRFMRRAS